MAYGTNALKGRYQVKNPEKYKGDVNTVFYRSSWELKFFNYCDVNANIVYWSSEEIVLKYISPIDGKYHRYFLDGHVEARMPDGSLQKYMVEIKPKKFTMEPVPQKTKTKAYINECIQWAVNQAKWAVATEVCADNGWKFLILTEKELGIS